MSLPDELLCSEIFTRLPVKDLFRFKCVSKFLCSLTSDRYFCIKHHEIGPCTERILSIDPLSPQFLSIDFNQSIMNNSAYSVLQAQFLRRYYFSVSIIGSCRGFLLLICLTTLCVWNPTNGFHKFVPFSPIWSSSFKNLPFILHGFGYDVLKEEYLVVLVSLNKFESESHHRVEIFSSNSNAWEEIDATLLPYYSYFSVDVEEKQTGLLFNGALHWLALNEDTKEDVVLVFDLANRTFSEIPLPVDLDFNFDAVKDMCALKVLGGLLNLCVVEHIMQKDNYSLQTWSMQQYGFQESWQRTMSVSVDDICSGYFIPVCDAENGDVVLENANGTLAKLNDEGKVGYQCYNVTRGRYSIAVFRESLLSM